MRSYIHRHSLKETAYIVAQDYLKPDAYPHLYAWLMWPFGMLICMFIVPGWWWTAVAAWATWAGLLWWTYRTLRALHQRPSDPLDDLQVQLLTRLAPYGSDTHQRTQLDVTSDGQGFDLQTPISGGRLRLEVRTSIYGLTFKSTFTGSPTAHHPRRQPPSWGWERLDHQHTLTSDDQVLLQTEGLWMGKPSQAAPILGDLLSFLLAPQHDPPPSERTQTPLTLVHQGHPLSIAHTEPNLPKHACSTPLHILPQLPRYEPIEEPAIFRRKHRNTLALMTVFYCGLSMLIALREGMTAKPLLVAVGMLLCALVLCGHEIYRTHTLKTVKRPTRRSLYEGMAIHWDGAQRLTMVSGTTVFETLHLDKPFRVSLSRSPDRSRLGVEIHQPKTGQRIVFQTLLAMTAEAFSLPRMERSAPWIEPRAFADWLWPLLTHHLELQGTPTPWRAILDTESKTAAMATETHAEEFEVAAATVSHQR